MTEEEKKGNKILPFKEWLRWNLTYSNPGERDTWKEKFATCLWWIWKWRNEEVFNANITSLEKKVHVVNTYTHEAAATFATQAIAMGVIGRPGLEWIVFD